MCDVARNTQQSFHVSDIPSTSRMFQLTGQTLISKQEQRRIRSQFQILFVSLVIQTLPLDVSSPKAKIVMKHSGDLLDTGGIQITSVCEAAETGWCSCFPCMRQFCEQNSYDVYIYIIRPFLVVTGSADGLWAERKLTCDTTVVCVFNLHMNVAHTYNIHLPWHYLTNRRKNWSYTSTKLQLVALDHQLLLQHSPTVHILIHPLTQYDHLILYTSQLLP